MSDETIFYLFSSTAKQRDQLGGDFLRLEHLVIRCSVVRHRTLVLNGIVWGKEKATHKKLDKDFFQEWFLVGTRTTQQHGTFLRIW
ncbi:hypothetical protein [Candidatus Parabeggiatoa sp. HSG14]|uniref:hypothetical protein n=1 Tax=Candidatus Parabeggiatoa sp. HSG14 TaxID=3055593 RepID=UPI0025A70E0D|nr:hypothetical protein [Thiotrichales bacterium HSG14]